MANLQQMHHRAATFSYHQGAAQRCDSNHILRKYCYWQQDNWQAEGADRSRMAQSLGQAAPSGGSAIGALSRSVAWGCVNYAPPSTTCSACLFQFHPTQHHTCFLVPLPPGPCQPTPKLPRPHVSHTITRCPSTMASPRGGTRAEGA